MHRILLVFGFLVAAAGGAEASAPAAVEPAHAFPHALTERVMGSPDAPVVLDEYFALTCSHCAHFHKQVLPQLKKDYIDTGKVRIVFHDFVFNEIGMKSALVARCVSESSYQEILATLFQMQESWQNPQGGEDVLKQVAGFAGLTPDRYQACVSDQSLIDGLLQVRVAAINDLGIDSTPTFLVRGTPDRIVGARDYAEFKKVIDQRLARVGETVAPAPAP